MYDAPLRPASVRCRATALWLSVSGAAVLLGAVVLPRLGTVPATDFAALLTWGCGAAALASMAWLWWVTTEVVLAVLRDPVRRRPAAEERRVAGPIRTALLMACGVLVFTTPTAGAAEVDHPRAPAADLAGLALPDRTTDRPEPGPEPAVVVVRPGDCLWTIAEHRLGAEASVAEVAAYWHRIYDRNRVAIGSDPDLIHPGLRLVLPPA